MQEMLSYMIYIKQFLLEEWQWVTIAAFILLLFWFRQVTSTLPRTRSKTRRLLYD
jgi:hypothetical protein